MRRLLLCFFIVCLLSPLSAQQSSSRKLMVGIVVDQMRAEYLNRFYAQFGEGGFKRLLKDGFNCRNTHINYLPTITGPGHASIYAGASPKYHGIVGNSWYDRQLKHRVYCVDDTTEKIVGAEGKLTGVSPRNLLPTNISDEIKISTNQHAKVLALSLKDRAAVLPAGHMADGAFWFDQKSGNFVTSTFYMNQLPEWVENFNKQKKAREYSDGTWALLLPEDQYPLSIADDNRYEGIFKGKDRPVFPYNLKELSAKTSVPYEVLYKSPFGSSLLTDLAIDALEHAGLGKGNYTDFLAISFSSPDAVGHMFGPLSKEINDTYLRLDRDLARLFDALDKYVGKGNYTLFLTADHGVDEVPEYLNDHKTPAGHLNLSQLTKELVLFLNKQLGEGKWIESLENDEFYLNTALLAEKGIDVVRVQNLLADYLRVKPGIAQVFTANQLNQQEFTLNVAARIQNGFYYKRCGDIKLVLEPGWTEDMYSTSTHGTGFTYDTHIPLIWYGVGINKGESVINHSVTDIAATVSMLLRVKFPSACTGNPIPELFK